MATSKTFPVTRRTMLRAGLAAAAASSALIGRPRGASADDTLAEVKKRGELVIATEMQFPPFDISDNGTYKGVDRDLIDAKDRGGGLMDGVHDLGGKEGFGPIDVNEPVVPFHHPWEGRMWAIENLTAAPDWTIDWWRYVRELIEPVDYLTRRYFDQWMQTQTAALIDSGILTLEEVISGGVVSARTLTGSPMQHHDVIAMVASRAKDYSHEIDVPPMFTQGDEVRARLMGATGHTRLPAYVRGRLGMIHAHHGAHVLPDASARGEERPEHLYSVAFRADALWPEASGRAEKVFLDLWESYLERP